MNRRDPDPARHYYAGIILMIFPEPMVFISA